MINVPNNKLNQFVVYSDRTFKKYFNTISVKLAFNKCSVYLYK